MKLELNVPTSLSEIKLAQYQKFLKIAEQNEDSEFLHQKMVQLFCGVDLKDIASIKHKDVMEITHSLTEMFKTKHKFIQRFKMGGVEFGFIPNLENISQGEFVDLDTYISDWSKMHKAMAVLYRPITKKINDKYQIEDYNGSITYSDVMKHAPLDVVLGATVFFLSFRERINEEYPDLFGGESADSEFDEQAQFGKRWGWYSSIYALAQGDVRRFDQISRLPLRQCLTYLTFEKQKSDIELKMIKRASK